LPGECDRAGITEELFQAITFENARAAREVECSIDDLEPVGGFLRWD
jgi:hypothetical protein